MWIGNGAALAVRSQASQPREGAEGRIDDAGGDVRSAQRAPARSMLEALGLLPAPPEGNRFHAFISYSHAADGKLAPALQSGLQRFARPWYRARALRIFRDDANLGASPHLWTSIQKALDDSEHFILLASPRAAASPWVERECARWRQNKSCDRLLIGLTEGEISWDQGANDFDWRATTALPHQLGGALVEEPRFIDLRWARNDNDLALTHARFRDSVADLAAPLHGVPKERLLSDEVRERRRAIRVARTAAAALVALTVAAVVATVLALIAQSQAQQEARVALSRALASEATTAFGAGSGGQIAAAPDRGVLLALEGYRLDANSATRGAVIEALEYTDHVEHYFQTAGGSIRSVAYSPNGLEVALGTSTRGIELWDASSGQMLGRPFGSVSLSLAINPDGSELAAVNGSTVSLWALSTHRLIGQPLAFGHLRPMDIAFAPSGDLIVGGGLPGGQGLVSVWNLARRTPSGAAALRRRCHQPGHQHERKPCGRQLLRDRPIRMERQQGLYPCRPRSVRSSDRSPRLPSARMGRRLRPGIRMDYSRCGTSAAPVRARSAPRAASEMACSKASHSPPVARGSWRVMPTARAGSGD